MIIQWVWAPSQAFFSSSQYVPGCGGRQRDDLFFPVLGTPCSNKHHFWSAARLPPKGPKEAVLPSWALERLPVPSSVKFTLIFSKNCLQNCQ